jgi:hypothetical protein
LQRGWYIGAFVLAPLIIFNNKKTIGVAAITLAMAIFLTTLVALGRHAGNGFSFATINEAVFPFFRNHVNYSAMLVCIVPVFFALFYLSKTKKLKSLIVLAIIIVLAALFFAYARGAWLAFFAGLLSYWLIKKRLLFYSYIVAIIITISSLFWIKANENYLQFAHDYKTTIFHENFREHMIATYKLKDVSTAERFYRWIAGSTHDKR